MILNKFISIILIITIIVNIFVKDVPSRRAIIIEGMLQNGAMGFVVGSLIYDDVVYLIPIAIYALLQYCALLFYIANWPVSRIDHWDKLLVARAIENQCFVAAVNRVGSDINGVEFSGHSSLIDYNGDIIYRGNNNEQLKTFTINKADLNSGRSKLPFLKDVDSFVIN